MTQKATGLVAIRPEPGLTSTLALGRELGLPIISAPLFEIRSREWEAPGADTIDALLIGSANAFLHGGECLSRFAEKPVHAVGKATARAAKDAGFTIAAIGAGGLQNVLDAIVPPACLLRIAGAEHVALDVPDGIAIHTVIAYESVARPLDPALISQAGDHPLVLLHSAAAAAHFAAECDRLGIARDRISLAALGPRISAAAGENWRAVHVAPHPSDRQMLEMLRETCI